MKPQSVRGIHLRVYVHTVYSVHTSKWLIMPPSIYRLLLLVSFYKYFQIFTCDWWEIYCDKNNTELQKIPCRNIPIPYNVQQWLWALSTTMFWFRLISNLWQYSTMYVRCWNLIFCFWFCIHYGCCVYWWSDSQNNSVYAEHNTKQQPITIHKTYHTCMPVWTENSLWFQLAALYIICEYECEWVCVYAAFILLRYDLLLMLLFLFYVCMAFETGIISLQRERWALNSSRAWPTSCFSLSFFLVSSWFRFTHMRIIFCLFHQFILEQFATLFPRIFAFLHWRYYYWPIYTHQYTVSGI